MAPVPPTVSTGLSGEQLLRLVRSPSVANVQALAAELQVSVEALWTDLELLAKNQDLLHDWAKAKQLPDAQWTRISANLRSSVTTISREAAKLGGRLARLFSLGEAAAGISLGTIAAGVLIGGAIVGGIMYYTIGPGAADKPMAVSEGMQDAQLGRRSAGDQAVAGAGSERYCAWYADNIGYKPVFVGPASAYEAEQLTNTVQGGGLPDRPAPVMIKMLIVECVEATAADAVRAACAQFGPSWVAPQTLANTEWLATRDDVVHDVDNLGGCR